jgi:hypothetical protein
MPPWEAHAAPQAKVRTTPRPTGPRVDLLVAHPDTVVAVAAVLGSPGEWRNGAATKTPEHGAVGALLTEHPMTGAAIANLLGIG